MKPLVSLRTALSSPDLFGPLLGGESWRAWRVVLVASMGEQLDAEELAIFRSLTGREASHRRASSNWSQWWAGVAGRTVRHPS